MNIHEINPRRPLPELKARFHVRRGLFRGDWVEAPVFALGSQGCILKTDEIFETGDRLTLELHLEMPFEGVHLTDMRAEVSDCRKYCSNFFYHIVFSSNADKTSNGKSLDRMQDLLNRKLALKQRRGGSTTMRSA